MEQNRDLREAHEKNLNEMKELKRFQGSALDTISRRKLTEDRDIILELTGEIQELQNEINCMSDSREILKMLNQFAVDNPALPVNLRFPTFSKCWRNAVPFSGNAEPQRLAAKYLGHTWFFGKRFCKFNGVLFSTLSARVKFSDL